MFLSLILDDPLFLFEEIHRKSERTDNARFPTNETFGGIALFEYILELLLDSFELFLDALYRLAALLDCRLPRLYGG